MKKSSYDQKAEELSRAIDIAVESVKKYPPKGFKQDHLSHFVNVYLDYKKNALYPEPKYHNTQNLLNIQNDILTYYQEGSGDAVEYFWRQIKYQNIGFKRVNKLAKILKRGKIKNQMEYDFIVDVLVPYEQEGLITKMHTEVLSRMLSDFEQRLAK